LISIDEPDFESSAYADELAALYSFVFLFIATYGPGSASLDRKFRLDA